MGHVTRFYRRGHWGYVDAFGSCACHGWVCVGGPKPVRGACWTHSVFSQGPQSIFCAKASDNTLPSPNKFARRSILLSGDSRLGRRDFRERLRAFEVGKTRGALGVCAFVCLVFIAVRILPMSGDKMAEEEMERLCGAMATRHLTRKFAMMGERIDSAYAMYQNLRAVRSDRSRPIEELELMLRCCTQKWRVSA